MTENKKLSSLSLGVPGSTTRIYGIVDALTTPASKYFNWPGQGINVKDYGATGDGVTDDTAAIQAAIDACPGGVVYFPPGIYKLSSTTITLDGVSNVYIRGDKATIDNSANDFRVFDGRNCTDITIDGLIFTGSFRTSDTNYASCGALVTDNTGTNKTKRLTIKNCFFDGLNGDAIRIGPGSEQISIINNIMLDGLGFAEVVGTTTNPVKNVLISGNHVYGTISTPRPGTFSGSDDLIDSLGQISGLTITDNHIEIPDAAITDNIISNGILLYANQTQGVTSDVIIANNHFKNIIGDGGIQENAAVWISSFLDKDAVQNVLISGNIINECRNGIKSYYCQGGVSINANYIKDTYKTPIRVESDGGEYLISENIIDTSVTNFGIYAYGTKFKISNNTLIGITASSQNAIAIETANQTEITFNKIVSGGAGGNGIVTYTSDNAVISNNSIYDHPGTAILVELGCNDCFVSNNYFSGNTIDFIDNGTATKKGVVTSAYVAATTLGNVASKITVLDQGGNIVGYIPVYDAIT